MKAYKTESEQWDKMIVTSLLDLLLADVHACLVLKNTMIALLSYSD